MGAPQIRERLGRGETILMPGVYDALTAGLAAQAGFEVLFLSGYSVSASRLGTPESIVDLDVHRGCNRTTE